MTRDETVLILRHISCSSSSFNYRETGVLETWHSIFKDYDYSDAFKKANALLEEDRFQYQVPTPQMIVRDLRKISEKAKLNSYKVACRNCGKVFNSYEEEEKHFDRCLSVEYILRQYKRFNLEQKTTKKEWYEMPEEEFREKYNQVLKYVQNHTNDNEEKLRIDYIFNPPCSENAKKFLSKGR